MKICISSKDELGEKQLGWRGFWIVLHNKIVNIYLNIYYSYLITFEHAEHAEDAACSACVGVNCSTQLQQITFSKLIS